MPPFYTTTQRNLQDRFGSRDLAEGLAAGIVVDALPPEQAAFVEGLDSFYLATTDSDGWPSVSHKGGPAGVVQVLDPRTLAFPSYDGNGMYLSLGNIAAHPQVGLLFIDHTTPRRLRVRGTAELSDEPDLLARWPGAELAVRVAIDAAWVNCPRYVHRSTRVATSRHVPDAAGSAPLAAWKRIDALQAVLPAADRERAAAAGLLTAEAYERMVRDGEA